MKKINIVRQFIGFLSLVASISLIEAMKPVATTPGSVGDDWYTYALNHGLGNPVRVQINNNLDEPVQIIYKQINDFKWDVFPTTLTAINDISAKTSPFPAYIIKTSNGIVYILNFEPFTPSSFKVTLYKSLVPAVQINKLAIVNELALSRDPIPLAQMVTNNPKQTLVTQELHKGDIIRVRIEADTAHLMVEHSHK